MRRLAAPSISLLCWTTGSIVENPDDRKVVTSLPFCHYPQDPHYKQRRDSKAAANYVVQDAIRAR
jgi:hypothetical protein